MISVAIIHAPRSEERIANTRALLELVPGAELLVDETGIGDMRFGNRRGCWPMARRAWASAPADATHRLVLEDDADPCDGFLELAAAAAARAPDAIVSFFRGPRTCSFATMMPTSAIAPFLAWADRESRWRPHHDHLLELGAAALGMRFLHTEPSLVEHADMRSLLDHPPVRALRFERRPAAFALVS